MSTTKGIKTIHEVMHEIPNWHYQEPRKSKNNCVTTLFINPREGVATPIRFQVSMPNPLNPVGRCRAPFGISAPFEGGGGDPKKRNFAFTLESSEMLEFFEAIDANILRKAEENSQSWFRKKMDPDTIRSQYHFCVSGKDDPKYKPLVSTKVIYDEDPAQVKVFIVVGGGLDDTRVEYRVGSPTDITPFDEVVPIVEITGMYFMSKQFGVSLRTTHILLFPKPKESVFGFVFPENIQAIAVSENGPCIDTHEEVDDVKEGHVANSPVESLGEWCWSRLAA